MSTTTTAALVTTTPKNLAADLAAVKPAVTTRSALAALAGVRIFTADGYAYAETTDMTTFARRRMTITVSGDMDVVVSHADLAKAVKLFLKRGYVALNLADDGRLAVTDGARTITLRELRREDWPEFPTGELRELFTSPAGSDLSAVLLRAARFASSDETRPILTGIAFNHAGEDLRAWATDSYRLADLAVPTSSVRPAEAGAVRESIVNVGAGIVKAAKAMVKAGEVRVYTLPNHAVVEFGRETWAVRLIAGSYPDFAQLIPDGATMTVRVPVAELAGACDVAVAFARRNAPMRLRVNGTAEVTGTTPDVADFRELLPGAVITKAEPDAKPRTVIGQAPAEPAEGDEMEVGLNPEFVRDIAAAHVGETAELRLISGLRPVLFVEDGDLYLQMPIRLKV